MPREQADRFVNGIGWESEALVSPAPLPWSLEEMTTSIVIRSADGVTVCNLPFQRNRARRMQNAKLIVDSVNARMDRK